jgi:two-component system, OmpR family, sensor histidine kinase VicK
MNESSVLAVWTQEQMYDRIVKLIENAKTEVLAFLNSYTLMISTDNEKFQTPKREARKRGVKFRYITEITKDNLSYCKRQLDMVDELRHINKVRGNFLMSESESIASQEVSLQHPITDGYYTDSKKIVKMMGYIFETLWDNAIPAEERINQLETGSYSLSSSSYAIAKEESH